jgi:hypothetical protein
MKKALLLFTAAALALGLASCKKSNLTNVWIVDEVYVNDTLQDMGTVSNHTLELTKEGVAILTVLGGATVDPVEGTWEWGDGKKTIIIHYPSATPDPDNVPVEYTVEKLKSKVMWLSRNYDNTVTIDRVETHYIPYEN